MITKCETLITVHLPFDWRLSGASPRSTRVKRPLFTSARYAADEATSNYLRLAHRRRLSRQVSSVYVPTGTMSANCVMKTEQWSADGPRNRLMTAEM